MSNDSKKHKLGGGQIGSLVLAGVALLCVAVGQPYAAAVFVFVSIIALFSGRPGRRS